MLQSLNSEFKHMQKNTSQREENIITQTISRYLPYWPLFGVLVVAAMATAWGYLYITPKVYESNARILIKDEKKGTEDSKALEELNLLSTKKIIENETEVIQSRTLLKEVVSDLSLHFSIMEQGRFKDRSAYVASPVKIEGTYGANIASKEKIFFSVDHAAKKVSIEGAAYPMDQWVSTPYGKLRFIANPHFKGTAPRAPLYFQIADPKAVVASIQKGIKVSTNSKQSSILTLTLRDEVPERSEDILNSLLQAYSKATVTDKNTLAANTLASVEARLKSVEHDLDSIERQTEQYKSDKGVVDISEQGRLFLENVSSNDQRINDAGIQLAVLDEIEQYVHAKNSNGGMVPSTAGISDPVLPNLLDKLYNLELEKERTKNKTGENHPVMTGISDQIEKIKPAILENIQSQRKSLLATTRNMTATNRSYASLLHSIPQKERKLIEINRQQNIKSSIYTFLLQKREETALTHASTVSDSRIIDKADSDIIPVSPKSKAIYVAALLAALLVGVAFIVFREGFNRKIMFREEIYQYATVPVIGEISSSNNKNPIVIGDDEKTFIAAQFRKLRSSLAYLGITGRKKRIMITSSISGEGKSFVSVNLAISLALTGKKVVLIDADLNNSSLAAKLHLDNHTGLTEYLTAKVEEDSILQPTRVNEHLYFIGTGKLPRNPSELLMNERMEQLLNILDARFDYIVVDTAPVGLVTDAYAIAPNCDATVFVVRHGYTPKKMIAQMDEENKINHLHNIGIVFNDVRTRGLGDKYGYGYGRAYNDNNYYRLNKAGS
jgi:tyrosine-protein kinase Etk/Wzc